jgi:hypothetical protein
MPDGVLSKSAEGKLFSNQEAVCLKSDDSSRPWNLDYALTDYTVNERQLFVTVHSRGEVDGYDNFSKWHPEYTAAIYVKSDDKFELLKRLSTEGQSYFHKPDIFPVHFERADIKDDWKQLIQITEVYDGTGGLTKEHIFTAVALPVGDLKLTPDVKLEEVEFIPASESYLFSKNECLKSESDTLADYNPSFTFLIRNLSDRNSRAIAKVVGTYKLEQRSDGKLRIIMDSFKREPISNSP